MTGSQAPDSSGPELYKVVVNHEEQYAIWPAHKPVPAKWSATGVAGSKEECLAYVRRVWSDMRPSSVRERNRVRGQRGGADDSL